MTSQPLGGENRDLGESQRLCRNSCLLLKGQAGHLWPDFSPFRVFLVWKETRALVGAVTCRRQKCHAHIWLSSGPSGGPGSSGAPASGLGESAFGGARAGREATGPLALFSVSGNTIEVLQSLRERLQSALLQERGAGPRRVGFWSLVPGEGVERPGTSRVRDSCDRVGLCFSRGVVVGRDAQDARLQDKGAGWGWGAPPFIKWLGRPGGASNQSPRGSPAEEGNQTP